jgi:hypothetical protein
VPGTRIGKIAPGIRRPSPTGKQGADRSSRQQRDAASNAPARRPDLKDAARQNGGNW